VVDHIWLFPLRKDVRWRYRVHEPILPALWHARIPVEWTDIVVQHTGHTDPALRARKPVRNERILQEELKARPEDPFVLFNLGSIAVEREDWATAIGFLRRSLPGSGPTDSITRKLFSLIARSYQMLGDYNGALGVCAEGLRVDPDDAELLFRKALAHRLRGKPGDAEACWRKIFGLKRLQQFSSVDQGIYGHLTERNLAALAAERGDQRESLTLWPGVLAECPSDQEAGLCVRRIEAPVD
jgi:tetratricopeptide (TPR) repeat protein